MNQNDAKPDANKIAYWKRLTDGNSHRDVRKCISDWAADHSSDERLKNLYRYIGKEIFSLYSNAMRTGRWGNNDLEVACDLTDILIKAIGREYGKDTAALIDTCL